MKIVSHRELATWAEALGADPSVLSPISQSCPHPWVGVPGHLRTQEVAQLILAQIPLERMAEVPLGRSKGQIQTFFTEGAPSPAKKLNLQLGPRSKHEPGRKRKLGASSVCEDMTLKFCTSSLLQTLSMALHAEGVGKCILQMGDVMSQ